MSEVLLERKRELMRRRLAGQGLARQQAATATAAAGLRPLSPGQRRMWLAQSQDPGGSTLNICVAYRLTGDLDIAKLRTAVAAIAARHEILRTTYHLEPSGELRQEVHDSLAPVFAEHDLTEVPEPVRAQRLQVLARRDFAQAFDLAADSPLRVTALRIAPDEHVLVLTAHHICWDDDSWSVFFAELGQHYSSQAPSALSHQYADIVNKAEPSTEGLAHWRHTLAALPEPMELPGERLWGTSVPSNRAGRHERRVPAQLMDRVRDFARAEGATPGMVLLAAFAAVLRRHTTSSDFLVMTPVGVRGDARMQGLIGYFGNVLPLRCAVLREDTLRSLAARARETCLAAFTHQDVDLNDIVAAGRGFAASAGKPSDVARVGFSTRGGGSDSFTFAGVRAQRLDLRAPVTQLPLSLAVELSEAGALVEMEYQADVVPGDLAADMLRHYVRFLDNALAAPERLIAQVEMADDEERAAQLAACCGRPAPTDIGLLHGLIEQQAAETSEAVAVAWEDGQASYRELNARANRLAHWLIGQQIGPEDVVALQITASVEFLVAVLAVLKAGGAYLPVDPVYPQERIAHMLSDARPKLVLDAGALAAAEAAAVRLCEANPADADRVRPLRGENLAYIIYTSGSTGRPKGVAVAHREIAAHTLAQARNFDVGAQDRLLQLASVSFDASLSELFIPLCAGGRLVIPKPGGGLDIAYLSDLIVQQGVTVVHMIPSLLAAVLSLPQAARWRSLRRMPVGGEALPAEVADKAASLWGVQLGNFYGPTEAVVCATGHLVVHPAGSALSPPPTGGGTVPIGTPLAGVRAYLLDDMLELAPPGVIGELYLGGEHLARGYLGAATLTAERFVADPFVPEARMYRTGDLARRNAAGELEFIGRADEQVKIRGFRIELSEVAAAVSAHPGVGQCVVVAVDLLTTGRALVAYVVPAQGSEVVSGEQVKAQAATVLPEHMVPAAVVLVDQIPLTPSGKLDHKALPEPVVTSGTQYREPATATERRLADLFASILGLSAEESSGRVGAEDSFFELGGHSLLATRLVARIRAEFDIDLDARAPFDAPTPAALAVIVESCGTTGRALPPLVPRPRPERAPLSNMQQVFWFQQRLLGPNPVYNMLFAFRVDGPLDVRALADAFADVVARHEALRTTFPDELGQPYQLVHPPEPVLVPVIELPDDETALDQALAEDAAHCYVLESELPLRVRVFVLGHERHVLSVLLHHLVSDHGSAQVFFTDLATAYRARVDGREPQWSPLPIQYGDYALWQQEHFATADSSAPAKAQLESWAQALAGLPALATVPPDRPRPALLSRNGATEIFAVPQELRERIAAFAKAEAATEFMVLHAALAALAHQFGAGEDIPIGTPVSGRNEEHTVGLIGLFANLVTVRADVSGDPTPHELLARSKQSALVAYANQDLSFDRVVDALLPERSLAQHPFFQIMLHLREQPQPIVLGEGPSGRTTATPLALPFEFALTDLMFALFTEPDHEGGPGGGYEGSLVYNVDLYDKATAQALVEALLRMLQRFVDAPDAPARLDGALERVVVVGPDTSSVLFGFDGDPDELPATETERALASLLEALLGTDDIRRGDSFFALGGDSIIAIALVSRANADGLTITPQMVFEHPRLAELAAAVDASGGEAPPAEDTSYAPMSASGLPDDMLASLTASWGEQG